MTFLKAWARHPAAIGAIAPSSTALARRMVAGVNPRPGEAIVEFGPGTGPFTRAIESLLADPSAYLGIEREPSFVKVLRAKFPRLRFVENSAEAAPRLLREAGLGPVRAVLCGLPFASLQASVQDAVIAALEQVVHDGCEFRTFQYVHAHWLPSALRYRRRMAEVFGPHQRSRIVLKNLPPAYVLTWRRGTEPQMHKGAHG